MRNGVSSTANSGTVKVADALKTLLALSTSSGPIRSPLLSQSIHTRTLCCATLPVTTEIVRLVPASAVSNWQLRSAYPSVAASKEVIVWSPMVTLKTPKPETVPVDVGTQAATGRGPFAFTMIGKPDTVSEPKAFETIKTGVYVPSVVYTCRGASVVSVPLSPKSQAQEVGMNEETSVNCTMPSHVSKVLCSKAATGGA